MDGLSLAHELFERGWHFQRIRSFLNHFSQNAGAFFCLFVFVRSVKNMKECGVLSKCKQEGEGKRINIY